MKKYLSIVLCSLVLAILLPISAGATTTSSTTTVSTSTQAQLELIANLNKQIVALQAQIKALQQDWYTQVINLAGTLREGSKGEQVRKLQQLLRSDRDIYPEGYVTGNWGPLTSKAFAKFLTRYEKRISSSTWATSSDREDDDDDRDDDKKGNAWGKLIAPGQIKKDGPKPIAPSLCLTLPRGIAKKLGVCNGVVIPPTIPTTTPTSTPDTTAPSISGISISNVSSTTARVVWTTNELSTGLVYVATTTPSLTTPTLSLSTLSYGHDFIVTGLATSTEYKLVVGSADAAGNKATSSVQTFETDND